MTTSDQIDLIIEGPGRNALGESVMANIIKQARAAGGRPLFVTGAGSTFSAGLNLKEVASLDEPGMRRFLGLLNDVIDALYNYPGPTVACVNGHAIAGGCMIALCCDLRIVADDSAIRIGLNEVPLGLEFPPKLIELARRRISRRWIDRVILEGALHDPQTAYTLGLVDEVASDAPAAARAALGRLASSPLPEYLAAKRALRPPLDLTAAQRKHHDEHIVPAWCAPAVKERARAALARR
jgi:enoyl-CoA hydratase/carnithine racemase